MKGLITVKDEASRTFSITLINVNDCDINLSDGTILSKVERIEIANYLGIHSDFGKEIRDNVRKFCIKEDES